MSAKQREFMLNHLTATSSEKFACTKKYSKLKV